MNELDDIKLKALLQSMELDKPAPDFSTRVMDKIFAENSAFEKIKNERILGKRFWLIPILFIVILALAIILGSAGIQSDGLFSQYLPDLSGVLTISNNMITKIGSLPLSIVGILIATSVLLFIDRFVTSNSKLFDND